MASLGVWLDVAFLCPVAGWLLGYLNLPACPPTLVLPCPLPLHSSCPTSTGPEPSQLTIQLAVSQPHLFWSV